MCVVPGLRSTVVPLPACSMPVKLRVSVTVFLRSPVMVNAPANVPVSVPVGIIMRSMSSIGSAVAVVSYTTLIMASS